MSLLYAMLMNSQQCIAEWYKMRMSDRDMIAEKCFVSIQLICFVLADNSLVSQNGIINIIYGWCFVWLQLVFFALLLHSISLSLFHSSLIWYGMWHTSEKCWYMLRYVQSLARREKNRKKKKRKNNLHDVALTAIRIFLQA